MLFLPIHLPAKKTHVRVEGRQRDAGENNETNHFKQAKTSCVFVGQRWYVQVGIYIMQTTRRVRPVQGQWWSISSTHTLQSLYGWIIKSFETVLVRKWSLNQHYIRQTCDLLHTEHKKRTSQFECVTYGQWIVPGGRTMLHWLHVDKVPRCATVCTNLSYSSEVCLAIIPGSTQAAVPNNVTVVINNTSAIAPNAYRIKMQL